MRPPHLTTELDALFLETLKRACVETEVPECMREAVIGLLSGSMDLYTANEKHNPANLYSPERVEKLLGPAISSPWYSISSALHMLTPMTTELSGRDSSWASNRIRWDCMARKRLVLAISLLDNPQKTHEISAITD